MDFAWSQVHSMLQPGEQVLWIDKPTSLNRLPGQIRMLRWLMIALLVISLALGGVAWLNGSTSSVLVSVIGLFFAGGALIQMTVTGRALGSEYITYALTDRRALRMFTDQNITWTSVISLDPNTEIEVTSQDPSAGRVVFKRRPRPGQPGYGVAQFVPKRARFSWISFDGVREPQRIHHLAQQVAARNATVATSQGAST